MSRPHLSFSLPTGSSSSWVFSSASSWWGFRCSEQKESSQCRQDLTAITFSPVHTSQKMSWVLVSVSGTFWTSLCLCSMSSLSRTLTLNCGFFLNSCWQSGHRIMSAESQWVFMQSLQKLCPQGVETGSAKSSRQIEHLKIDWWEVVVAIVCMSPVQKRQDQICDNDFHC